MQKFKLKVSQIDVSACKKAKFIYRSLIDNIVQNPTDKFLKWEELLDIEITDWSEYFVIMKRSCRDIKI
jgi:hypothetical protein